MVNYKRVVCEVAVIALFITAAATAPAPDCHEVHYDQRQNGSENYRLKIDGVVIAVAPVESFLAAVSEIDIDGLLEELNDSEKPKPPIEHFPSKPEPAKPDEVKPDAVKPQESKPETLEKPEKPISDVTLNPETKGQKKATGRKPIKAQRLKTLIANMFVPMLRRHQK